MNKKNEVNKQGTVNIKKALLVASLALGAAYPLAKEVNLVNTVEASSVVTANQVNFIKTAQRLPNVSEVKKMNPSQLRRAIKSFQSARDTYNKLSWTEQSNASVAKWIYFVDLKEDAATARFVAQAINLPNINEMKKMTAKEFAKVNPDITAIEKVYESLPLKGKQNERVIRWVGYLELKADASGLTFINEVNKLANVAEVKEMNTKQLEQYYADLITAYSTYEKAIDVAKSDAKFVRWDGYLITKTAVTFELAEKLELELPPIPLFVEKTKDNVKEEDDKLEEDKKEDDNVEEKEEEKEEEKPSTPTPTPTPTPEPTPEPEVPVDDEDEDEKEEDGDGEKDEEKTIVSEEPSTSEVVVEYETEIVENEDEYVGYREVVQEGKDGLRVIESKLIKYSDGTEETIVVSTTDEEEMVKEIVHVGVKALPEDGQTVEETETHVKVASRIPFTTIMEFSDEYPVGTEIVKVEGVDGLLFNTFEKANPSEPTSTEIFREAIDEVVIVGTKFEAEKGDMSANAKAAAQLLSEFESMIEGEFSPSSGGVLHSYSDFGYEEGYDLHLYGEIGHGYDDHEALQRDFEMINEFLEGTSYRYQEGRHGDYYSFYVEVKEGSREAEELELDRVQKLIDEVYSGVTALYDDNRILPLGLGIKQHLAMNELTFDSYYYEQLDALDRIEDDYEVLYNYLIENHSEYVITHNGMTPGVSFSISLFVK